jgi:transposase
MDKAYESAETRTLVVALNMTPVVPPKSNRREPWDYDKELYKRRNIVERLFRRMKEYRKIFTRYDKLDVMFLAYIYWGLTFIALR